MTKKVKILVVDDEADLCHIVAEKISDIGNIICDCTYSAEEAIKLLKDSEYDILLTDINMPEMNGIELIKTIKGDPEKDLFCFIMTGFSDYTEEQVREAGALNLFYKPDDFPAMIAEIGRLAEKIK